MPAEDESSEELLEQLAKPSTAAQAKGNRRVIFISKEIAEVNNGA
jgi:hypothetical protein